MPSAVSTRTNSQEPSPRTPVNRCGSTFVILSDVSDSCAHENPPNLPDAIRLPVRPQEARLRKERREPLFTCLLIVINSFIGSDGSFTFRALFEIAPPFASFAPLRDI